MSIASPSECAAEAQDRIEESVWWDVSNHTYATLQDLNRMITTVMDQQKVPRRRRREIRANINQNWRVLQAEHPTDGTWSP